MKLLKEKREGSGIDIETVARRTRINSAYLRAIEDGNFSVLPGDCYIRGYIRTYAGILGLTPEEAIADYETYPGITKKHTLKGRIDPVVEDEDCTDPAPSTIKNLLDQESPADFRRPYLPRFLALSAILSVLVAVLFLNVKVGGGTHAPVEEKAVVPPPAKTTENEAGRFVTVTVDSATLRLDPFPFSESVTWASRGAVLKVIDEFGEGPDRKWYKVATSKGMDCWVSGGLVREGRDNVKEGRPWTIEAAYMEMSRTVRVIVKSATLRTEPVLDSEPVTWASLGSTLKSVGVYTDDAGKKWYKVITSDSKKCWIAGKVVDLSS